MTTVAAEFHTDTRRVRGLVSLNTFTFHRENLGHELFEVSITDAEGPFVVQVRSWGNMIRTVEMFTRSRSHVGIGVKADIYRTGYASVNGLNIRVTPIG
ncbi:hypothetical protein ACFV9E_00190 [Streptomyces sp. NPDC059835]|uniref:hypothetical protein n=1 Tax=Streptomyces sp. NPDC059835 TaxID=3346967 RepID=UPI0036669AAF